MLRFSRYPLAFILALVIGSSVLAQRDRDTYSNASANALEVVGQVRLVDTGLPAHRISVRLERFGGGVVDSMDTDSGGRFRFANLQRGYYKVIVNAPGFKPVPAELKAVLGVSGLFNLLFFVYPAPLIAAAGIAARSLF